MVIYSKNINVSSLVVNKHFLDRLEKIYELEKKSFNEIKLSITIKDSYNNSVEYSSFEEVKADVISEKINSLTIHFRNYPFAKKDYLNVSLNLESDPDSSVHIESTKQEVAERIKIEIIEIIKDFQTNFSWLYSLKNIPIYIINVIVAALFSFLIYQLFREKVSSNSMESVLLISFFVFVIIINKIMQWMFPKISFYLREQMSDHKKVLKYIAGVILLTLLGNFIWSVFLGGKIA